MIRTVHSLLLACLALVACKRQAADAKVDTAPERVIVTLAPTKLQTVERRVAVVGTIYGNEEITVSAKVSGRVQDVMQDVGDRVLPGDVLVQIARTDYELEKLKQEMALYHALAKLGLEREPEPGASFDANQLPTVRRALLQAQNAEAKLNRAKRLFEQKPPRISEQDFADLNTEWQVTNSNADVELLTARTLLAEVRARHSDLDLADQRLNDTTIRAPERPTMTVRSKLPGYAITTRMVSVGEYVREGDALFRLVDDHPVKLRATVPERFIGELKVDQVVAVTVEAYRDPFQGRVARLCPQIDPASRSFEIEVLIDNDLGRLIPGAFARGSVLVGVEQDVTFVPQAAVISYAGLKKVFTVNDGRAVEVVIETGRLVDDHLQVTRGLSGHRDVVVTGAAKLADGVAVQVKSAAEIDGPKPRAPRPGGE